MQNKVNNSSTSSIQNSFVKDELLSSLVNMLPFQLSEYQFQSYIGGGAFSNVFEVFSTHYNKKFCAKVSLMDENMVTADGRLADPELAALFELDHPNIIKFYDYFVYEGHLVLILDLCENQTLQRYVSGAKLQMSIINFIFRDILYGLLYCHTRSIAHRDIKPSNIFIDCNFRAIIADFGLASFNDTVDNACGSKNYCAPEVFSNQKYDPFAADVWALGVTFYQLIMHKHPFHVTCHPIGPNDYPMKLDNMIDSSLANLIYQMLSYNPKDRPTIEEIIRSEYFVKLDMEKIKKSRSIASYQIKTNDSLTSKDKRKVPLSLDQRSFAINTTSRMKIAKTKSAYRRIDKSTRSAIPTFGTCGNFLTLIHDIKNQ